MLLCDTSKAEIPAIRRITGHVFDAKSKLPLAGANVYVADNKEGCLTSDVGSFSISVPASATTVVTFSYVGFASVTYVVRPGSSTELSIFLTAGQTLGEQRVEGSKQPSVGSDTPMSTVSLSMTQLKKVPALLGEKDVLKMLQLMPGVQKGSEGNAGLYVRGGAPDQNLILLDNTPIYNPNHLLGFFSAFNGDALKQADLTKGGFPARFGGRLSSVVELTTKDGATDKVHAEATGGIVASRLLVSGPLSKKVTYVVAGRRTYLDLLTGLLGKGTDDQPVLKTFFYDVNAKLTIEAGDKDKLYVSGYRSHDRFSNVRTDGIALRSALQWTNEAGSIRWHHQGARGLAFDLSILSSRYRMAVQDEQLLPENSSNGTYRLAYQSAIRDVGVSCALHQYINKKHQLRYGVQATQHVFNPQASVSLTVADPPVQTADHQVNTAEAGAYVEHTWTPTDRWSINSGLRLSAYSLIGGRQDAPSGSAGEKLSLPGYVRPESRLSMAYRAAPTFTLKGSFALMNQYVHLLSSAGVGLSTDLWVPTVGSVKPQQSQQIALGIVKNFSTAGITLTVEGYHKQMNNLLSYREGASFLTADTKGSIQSTQWTDNVTSGHGRSSGAEVLLQKQTGRLSGWIGYTLSWTKWQFAELNAGKSFFPRYDRRHDASVVGIYELTPSITLSGSWVYGTGNALTLPLSRYSGYLDQKAESNPATASTLYGSGPNVKEYSERNAFRTDAYHRLDIGLRFTRKRTSYERVWELSVYNVYNRRNAFLYSLEGEEQGKGMPSKTVLYKYSLFPVVPSVSYTVRF
ncbi:TonB-dependent receptor [Spirosoma oryzicola]|nr:TonB-dependent receptor [Spirosoma oryzicola]UHG93637.1 TonB-dependent receptor [Spirosoma oryzicola]